MNIQTNYLPTLTDSQINRIVNRKDFKYKQQVSNMKKKLVEADYKTVLVELLVKEILYLNSLIDSHNIEEHIDPPSLHSMT